jgi:hypothetical protein
MDLSKLEASVNQADGGKSDKLPPVELWDPPFCGDIGLEIKRNGQWFYQNSPIGRKKLARLFSTILKKEGDDYFLVTPVEKVSVKVDDVPFVITLWNATGNGIEVETQTQDRCLLSAKHPVELRFDKEHGAQIPYVNIRRNLWARVHQNVYYQWAELANINEDGSSVTATLNSGDYQFSLGSFSA